MTAHEVKPDFCGDCMGFEERLRLAVSAAGWWLVAQGCLYFLLNGPWAGRLRLRYDDYLEPYLRGLALSLLCLGSNTPGHFESCSDGHTRIGARALALELHDWWLNRVRRDLTLQARITGDDLTLLKHQRLGHSSKRIAAELKVSEASINSRFQRVNQKLGVTNRKMAARLACECGLIGA